MSNPFLTRCQRNTDGLVRRCDRHESPSDALRLTIQDNGPGFRVSGVLFGGGLGLIRMHEPATVKESPAATLPTGNYISENSRAATRSRVSTMLLDADRELGDREG